MINKKIVATLLMALTATTINVNAEEPASQQGEKKSTIEVPEWVKGIKLSGYGMLQYQGLDKEDAHENSFNLRLARISIDGRVKDIQYKVQMQINGNTSTLGASPRLVDLWAEWQPMKEFNVKAGQFKRAFTFENPLHPITGQRFMSYSQNVSKLAGFSDRTGEQASNGRDIGVQIQGDLLPNANGRRLLHYQMGVYNGEGINQKDKDNKKDIIGGLWVMPVKGLRIGAFGWTGTRVITYDELGTLSVRKNRYALSAEYINGEYTFRSEYIHSQGYGAKLEDGDKADGFYALGIVPIVSKKLHAKARYDLYRNRKEWTTSKTNYEIGLDWFLTKNVQLSMEYARVNDRTLAKDKHNYNLVDVELDFRF